MKIGETWRVKNPSPDTGGYKIVLVKNLSYNKTDKVDRWIVNVFWEKDNYMKWMKQAVFTSDAIIKNHFKVS